MLNDREFKRLRRERRRLERDARAARTAERKRRRELVEKFCKREFGMSVEELHEQQRKGKK